MCTPWPILHALPRVADLARSGRRRLLPCCGAHVRAGAPCWGPCAAHLIVAQGAVSRASSDVSWYLPRPCRACLAIQPSVQAAPRYRPYRARANGVVAYFGRIVVAPSCIAQPYRGLVPLLCHDTMHCIVTQAGKIGSSPFQLQKLFFFFHSLFFFILFHLLEDPKKKKLYIYI